MVSGSSYQPNLELINETDKAWGYAEELCNLYDPSDDVWVLDVCETSKGDLHLLEIGCFSWAGMYANDLKTIVESICKLYEYKHRKY